jgi:hypothetical protein
MMAFAPESTALVTAIVIPRSLNEPVGFKPSNLQKICCFHPNWAGKFFNSIIGVLPSFKLITLVESLTGSRSRYLLINPV